VLATAGGGEPLIKICSTCLSVVLVSGGAFAQDASPLSAPTAESVEPGPAVVETPPTIAAKRVATRPPRFGDRGQFTLLGGSNVGISSTSSTSSLASSFGVIASPQLDYFVVRNISLGLDTYVSLGSGQGYGQDGSLVSSHTEQARVGGRVGVNLPFGRFFSWYPRVAFGYESLQRDDKLVSGQSISTLSPTGYPSTSQKGAYLDVYAPLLIHPVSHFFLGFGPELFQDFGNATTTALATSARDVGALRTSLGAGFVLGGYWGGSAREEAGEAGRYGDEAGAKDGIGPQGGFGKRGQVVFTNALVASYLTTTYALTSSGTSALNVGGSVDYFVVDHISLGNGAGISSSSYSLLDNATGNAVSNSVSGDWLTFRLGMSLPLGERVSLYPVVSVGVEAGEIGSQAAGPANERDTQEVFAAVFAPVLVHLAEHFFVGFGPNIDTDLWQRVTSPLPGAQSSSNRATSVGAGLELGGWVP
jgi:hypothetical protein